MQQTAPREDLHQRITNHIIAAIEAGADEYQMSWNPKLCTGPAIGLPHNPVGHYTYYGINIVALWASQQHNAYGTPEWATFRQWQAARTQVRKGEKGILTVFFKASGSGQQSAESDEQEPRRHFIAKAAYVFNAAQVDGFIPSAPTKLTPIERHAAAETLILASKASIYHDSRNACYIPSRDEIHLPPDGAFKDTQGYYSVALHELVHSSGHASRCDRELRNRFGTEAYATEELIAELGAAFLCAELGISPEPRIDHAHYVKSWLRVLKDDKRAIFTAAAKANQAANFLNTLCRNTQNPELPDCSGNSVGEFIGILLHQQPIPEYGFQLPTMPRPVGSILLIGIESKNHKAHIRTNRKLSRIAHGSNIAE